MKVIEFQLIYRHRGEMFHPIKVVLSNFIERPTDRQQGISPRTTEEKINEFNDRAFVIFSLLWWLLVTPFAINYFLFDWPQIPQNKKAVQVLPYHHYRRPPC